MRLSLYFELRHNNANICKCVTFTHILTDLSQKTEKRWDLNGCLLKGDISSQLPQRSWFEVLPKLKGCAIPFYCNVLLIHHLGKVPIPDEEQRADMIFHLGVQKELVSFVHKIS